MKKFVGKISIILALAVLGSSAGAAVASAAVAPRGAARGVTTVTLNQGTINAVVGLGLTPAPVSPGVLGMDGADLKAAFPIVGNMKAGLIKHTGGLSLTAGSTVLALTNYTIDTGRGVLTAMATLNGTEVGRIVLFNLGTAPSQTGCAATASLALSSDAAGALTAIFGAPDGLAGTDFGVACVAPRS